jgi:hypothetical protein
MAGYGRTNTVIGDTTSAVATTLSAKLPGVATPPAFLVSGGAVTLGSVHAYDLDIAAGVGSFSGTSVSWGALLTNPVTTAANTTGAQYRGGIIELESDGATVVTTFTATAASAAAAAALVPALATSGRITLATLAIPVSFTGGTTSFTAAMITNAPVVFGANPIGANQRWRIKSIFASYGGAIPTGALVTVTDGKFTLNAAAGTLNPIDLQCAPGAEVSFGLTAGGSGVQGYLTVIGEVE